MEGVVVAEGPVGAVVGAVVAVEAEVAVGVDSSGSLLEQPATPTDRAAPAASNLMKRDLIMGRS